MNAPAPIEFKQTAGQFVRRWYANRSLTQIGRLVSYLFFGLSVLVLIAHGMAAFSNGDIPILSLMNGRALSRAVWIVLIIDLIPWYLLVEIKRRELNTSTGDVFSFLDYQTRAFFAQTLSVCQSRKLQLDPITALGLMLTTGQMAVLLHRLELSTQSITAALNIALPPPALPLQGADPQFDPVMQEYLLVSAARAQNRGDTSFGLADVFYTMLEKDQAIAQFFEPLDITKERFAVILGWISTKDHLFSAYDHLRAERVHTGTRNQAWTSKPTPMLNHFGSDITVAASYGNVPLVSVREKEVEEAIRVLSRATKNSILLVGEPGVGKTAIVERIALRMIGENVPDPLKDKRLVQLDTAALHGVSQGFAAAFEQLVEETEQAGNVVLYVPNLEDLASEKTEGLPAAELLLPILERQRMQIIGATSTKLYRESIEPNVSFSEAFGVVQVAEVNEHDAVTILEEITVQLESRHHVTISLKALEAAVSLSVQYIHDRVLPEKAIDIVDEACVMVAAAKRNLVTEADIRTVITQKTNVPVVQMGQQEQNLLLNLEEELHRRVVGQEEAVKAVSEALRRARAGLADKNRPIGSFLFVGPTGVGKTELAKALSSIYFKTESAMVRLDMSEFESAESISRLLGEGNKEGLLTGPVRSKPFTLLLLDEFEKSAREIRNVFLQVFDDGRVTDGAGHVVDFKNCIIIATSNAGSLQIEQAQQQGSSYDQIKDMLTATILPNQYTPELLNRFDGIVVFRALTETEILQIAHLQVQSVVQQLQETSGVNLAVTEAATLVLAKAGFDPTMGGRPLRRVIQEKLEGPLSKKILAGGAKRGDHLTIDVADLAA